MNRKRNVLDAIREVVGAPDTHITGVVQSVDETAVTCNVLPDDEGEELKDVRIRSLNADHDLGFFELPKVGSFVLIQFVDGRRDLPVIQRCLEIEKVILRKESGFTVEIGAGDNVTIKKAVNIMIENSGNTEIKTDGNVKLDAAGTVELGKGANGGVLTVITQPACFVTGAPFRGSQTVKAKP